MSGSTPSSRSSSSPSAKSMRRKRVSHCASRANSSKRSSAAGSRSMQISVPERPMRSAIRRACPPPPKVQSITVSPGCGSVSSISSPARTGTCVRVMSRRMAKALRDLDDLRAQLVLVREPALAIPDLKVVDHAHQHHVLRDLPVREKRGVERDPAGRVQLRVERPAREEAGELAALGAEGVEAREEGVGVALERLRSPDSDAGLERLRENNSARERGPELGRDVE